MKMIDIKGFLSILTLLLPLISWAAPVSELEALRSARNFLMQHGKRSADLQHMQVASHSRRAASNTPGYYVFNVGEENGFVIISGDDRTEAVLGYGDKGTLDETTLPDGLRYLLDGYMEQLAWIESHEVQQAPRRAAARQSISPLVATRWNQGAPYNNQCPLINSERTVTGCVATAMAQVMNYHRYPTASTTGIPGYTARNKKTTQDALPVSTFDWNNMTATYASSDTDASANAVATLMQYCGYSIQMDYDLSSNGGSSAYNACIADALKTYFSYEGTINFAQRRHYSYQQWIELIYNELADNRPVVLGGQSAGGGHSFVCDGYDTGDYFHINWGWGGSSDGYFRLSALNPYEQGIGGSSTLDGFSFSQDAVLGIQPYSAVEGQPCVSLEQLQFTSAGTSMTQVASRTSAEEAFTGINLYFTLCSYRFGTNSYDYAVQLVSADGQQVYTLHEVTGQSMNFNTDYHFDPTLSTPAGLADGIYYLKVVSRANGQEAWQECYDGVQQQMSAVVANNQLTLTASFVYGSKPTVSKPTVSLVTFTGNKMVGYEQEVIVSVEGGSVDYHGNLELYVESKRVMGKTVDIAAGQTADVRFTYTPSKVGENALAIKAAGTQIGTHSETILASDAKNTQELTLTAIIANLNGETLYGNALRVTATVTNGSDDYKFVGQLNCSLRTYESKEATDYSGATVIHKNIEIEKGSTSDVLFEWTGLEKGKFYCLRFTYMKGNGEGGTNVADLLTTDRYEMDEGFLVYLDDATTSIQPLSKTISVAAKAVCVNLTSISNLNSVTITPSSNPNCLYLLAEGASTPASLNGCNVVTGTTAANIALTDGYNFKSPITFTATNISYTRTFTVAAAASSGWNTIMLPFDVQAISCDGLGSVDWFHSNSDTGKNFWLKTFVSDGSGMVNFDFATEMAAYTPYIIAVPGNTWGDSWRMTGRAVTFSGANATILPTAEGSMSGNSYQFCGTTAASSASNIYALNDAGSNFVKQTSASIASFRAWFEAISITSLSLPSLSIGSPEVTGITDVLPTGSISSANSYYTLDGRPLQGKPVTKGIYICQGKKIIIK